MQEEDQRKALAEIHGFTHVDEKITSCRASGRIMYGRWGFSVLPIPDYLNDISAIFEIQQAMVGPIVEKYVNEVRILCGDFVTDFKLINLPAKVRCKAILKAYGKWKY